MALGATNYAMKKILLLLTLFPAIATAVETGAQRFDRANEGKYFGNRERINPTSIELREVAKEQGVPLMKKGGFPVAPRGVPEYDPGAAMTPSDALREVPPTASYRTMGDAAKAGVDPLSLVKTMDSKAPVDSDDDKYELYYWIGGIGGFVVLAGIGFILSQRTPRLRPTRDE